MSNVQVPYTTEDRSSSDTATALLEAAEAKGMDASVVQGGSYGYFTVPEEVAKAAKVDYAEGNIDDPVIQEIVAEEDEVSLKNEPHAVQHQKTSAKAEAKPAKKAAAKKTAKKSTAKKAAKKSAKKS